MQAPGLVLVFSGLIVFAIRPLTMISIFVSGPALLAWPVMV